MAERKRKTGRITSSLHRQVAVYEDVQQGALAVVLLLQPHALRLVVDEGLGDGGHDLCGDRAHPLGHEKFERLKLARDFAARVLHGCVLLA